MTKTKHPSHTELPREGAPALADKHHSYLIEGELYLVYDDRLWRRTGQTHNPRTIAQADAVGWQGDLLTVHPVGKRISLQHKHTGVELRLLAAEWTDWCFVTFEEVEKFD